MKQIKVCFIFLVLALIGAAQSKAEEVYSFTVNGNNQPEDFDKSPSAATNQFTLDDVTWYIYPTAGSKSYSWSWSNGGIGMGSNNYYYTNCIVSTSGLSTYKINKIIVNTSGSSGTNATVAVSVNGVAFTCTNVDNETTTPSIAYEPKDYVFEYAAGEKGEITITYSQTSKYALYLSSVTVYSDESRLNPDLSYSADYLGVDSEDIAAGDISFPFLTYADGFDGLGDLTYTSSDVSIADIDSDGAISFSGAEGTTIITASFAGNDTYFSDYATYELKVKNTVYTFDFSLHHYGLELLDDGSETEEKTIKGKHEVVLSFLPEDSNGYGLVQYSITNDVVLAVYYKCYFAIAAPEGKIITGITMNGNLLTTLGVDVGNLESMMSTAVWTPDEGSDGASSVTYGVADRAAYIYNIAVVLSDEVESTGSFDISTACYATYYTDNAFIMPSGVTGTTITGVQSDGRTLSMPWSYTAGTVVPASTALLLKGAEGTYEYTITTTDETVSDNILYGSTTAVDTYVPGDEANSSAYYFYEFSYGIDDYAETLGFYWANDAGSAFLSEANKCWLAVPKGQTNIKGFNFGGIDTPEMDAIRSVENHFNAADAIYTVQGVKVSAMDKSGVYIVNGRKIIKNL